MLRLYFTVQPYLTDDRASRIKVSSRKIPIRTRSVECKTYPGRPTPVNRKHALPHVETTFYAVEGQPLLSSKLIENSNANRNIVENHVESLFKKRKETSYIERNW